MASSRSLTLMSHQTTASFIIMNLGLQKVELKQASLREYLGRKQIKMNKLLQPK